MAKKKKKTDDEVRDEEERANSMGLFNQAVSYWKAAVALQRDNLKTPFSDHPVWFLYYHAIELYLKSFLRMHGHTVEELASRKFGHRTCCLTDRAKQLGLFFMDEDVAVFSLMSTTDAIIRSRYIQRGYFSWPAHEALDRTCKSLHDSIGDALRAGGIAVRR
jgi:hypothetical protein